MRLANRFLGKILDIFSKKKNKYWMKKLQNIIRYWYSLPFLRNPHAMSVAFMFYHHSDLMISWRLNLSPMCEHLYVLRRKRWPFIECLGRCIRLIVVRASIIKIGPFCKSWYNVTPGNCECISSVEWVNNDCRRNCSSSSLTQVPSR
jgi:hypothetical protein